MKVQINKKYKSKELNIILDTFNMICPYCSKYGEYWGSNALKEVAMKSGFRCHNCKFEICFLYPVVKDDCFEYEFSYLKIRDIEYRAKDSALHLYIKNSYIKTIDSQEIDLKKIRNLIYIT